MRDEAIYLWIGARGQRPAVHRGTIGEHTAVIENQRLDVLDEIHAGDLASGAGRSCLFGTRLEDTSKVGFDDEFQYDDFKLPWKERKAVECHPDFEREYALKACQAWASKQDRHPY